MDSSYLYWAGLWGIAAAAGTIRALRDSDYRDLCSLASVGLFSGMAGFGIIAVFAGGLDGHTGRELRYLGLAALIGLMGKEQDRLVRYVVSQALKKAGVPEMPEQNILLGDDQPSDGDHIAGDSDTVEHREQ